VRFVVNGLYPNQHGAWDFDNAYRPCAVARWRAASNALRKKTFAMARLYSAGARVSV
jgi:hypothetical protein